MGSSAVHTTFTVASIADLTDTTAHLVNAALSDASKANYRRVRQSYLHFAQALQITRWTQLPIPSEALCLYLSHRFQKGLKGSSFAGEASAIAYLHKLNSLPDPSENFVVKKLLAGAHKLNPSADTRVPITLHVLKKMVTTLPLAGLTFYETILYKAVYSVAYFGLFRLGELIPCTKTNQALVLQCGNVHFDNQQHADAVITLRHSKNLKNAQPVLVRIERQEGIACPVQALWDFLCLRGNTAGPLFSSPTGEAVCRSHFSQHMDMVLNRAGFQSGLFKGHSFRIGRASDCSAQGVSEGHLI